MFRLRTRTAAPAAGPAVASARALVEPLEGRAYCAAAAVAAGGTTAWLGGPLAAGPGLVMDRASGPTAATVGPAAVTTAAVTTAGGSPLLGGNPNHQSDRIQDLAFVDLVKTSRGFYNVAGRKASNGHADFARATAQGWPTEDFSFDVVDNTEWGVPVAAGLYKMAFRGPAGVAVKSSSGVALRRVSYDAATGTHTYDVTVPAGLPKLGFTFAKTGGQVRGLRVLQPGYGLTDTPVFAAEYLAMLRDLAPGVLRFMEFMKTNNQVIATWGGRAKPTDATWSKVAVPGDVAEVPGQVCPGDNQPLRGIPWEHAIALANALGSDVWVNIPGHADDDYVRQLAALLRTTLRADLKIYVEYSNEVWNSIFEQARYNKTVAVREVIADKQAGRASQLNYDKRPVDTTKTGDSNPNADTWGDRRFARRTKRIGDLFRSVWTAAGQGNPINGRVRVVLAGQVANLSRFDNELAFLNRFYGPPKNYLYGLGVAPYFSLNKYKQDPNATVEQLLEGMSRSVAHYENDAVLTDANGKSTTWGLKLVAYEAGADLQFGALNVANKRAAALDPRMAGIVARYLTTWYAHGGGALAWFTMGASSHNDPCGTWSMTESRTELDSPKIQGYKQVRDALVRSASLRSSGG